MLPFFRGLIALISTTILAGCAAPTSPTIVEYDVAPPTQALPAGDTDLEYVVVLTDDVHLERSGVPWEVEDENCNASSSNSRTETRATTFKIAVQIEAGAGLGLDIGLNALVTEANLEAGIANELNLEIGAESEASSSVTINTEPGSVSTTTFQWVENWTRGTVSVVAQDGSQIGPVEFFVLNNLTLQRETASVLCNGNPQAEAPTPTPTAGQTPATQATVPDPNPIWLGTVDIPGYQETGVRFDASECGHHELTLVEGAYSPWPSEDYPGNQGWITMIYIYKNSDVMWGTRETGLVGPIDPTISIGWGGFEPTLEEAAARGNGMAVVVDLQPGDYLVFVPIDERTAYNSPANNRGSVLVSVDLIARC